MLFKEYVANNLCIEKEVEDSCCKGKCFVNGDADESKDDDSAISANRSDNKTEQEKIHKIETFTFGLSSNIISLLHICYQEKYLSETIFRVFHPPRLSRNI